eukprot:gb/GECH01011134.1/.p1 GENE.gb/GECH01011134.1/~~gb/GECH01011134.1/.p1  ORF type:complete len:123 (+),score=17.96 gb/GECH01011134.1/:1-369(+)
MVKAYELRTKSKAELENELEKLKKELFQLRVSKVTGGAPNKLNKMRTVRKDISRVLNVMTEMQRNELRKVYNDPRKMPYDLRPKTLRKERRALTNAQLSKMTRKQAKRALHYPKRQFIVRAD